MKLDSRDNDFGPTGLARALSKLGICSRKDGFEWVRSGRVRVNGVAVRDPERRVRMGRDCIEVDGERAVAGRRVYVMLNKPRGLVTTVRDERGRPTVFQCLEGSGLPRVVAVGRLDFASEGLLLFTNDSRWADDLTRDGSGVRKVYHVHVDGVCSEVEVRQLTEGVRVLLEGREEVWRARDVRVLRSGGRTMWLEVVLMEGKNRQIRRMIEAIGKSVKRLVRVAIGGLELGELKSGEWRELTEEDVRRVMMGAGRGAWEGGRESATRRREGG